VPEKRSYSRPAVLSEDRLEQTSLACNATQDFPEIQNGIGVFAPGLQCETNVHKGVSFADLQLCQILVQRGMIVVSS